MWYHLYPWITIIIWLLNIASPIGWTITEHLDISLYVLKSLLFTNGWFQGWLTAQLRRLSPTAEGVWGPLLGMGWLQGFGDDVRVEVVYFIYVGLWQIQVLGGQGRFRLRFKSRNYGQLQFWFHWGRSWFLFGIILILIYSIIIILILNFYFTGFIWLICYFVII